MKKISWLSMVMAVLLSFYACDKDTVITETVVTVQINLPEGYSDYSKDNYEVIWTNLSNQRSTSVKTDDTGIAVAALSDGIYKLDIKGESKNTEAADLVTFQGSETQVPITGGLKMLSVNLEQVVLNDGFLIREVYFSGSKTPNNKNYFQDQYIEIYNNSAETLYADGLSIAESMNTNSVTTNLWGKFLPNTIAVGTVYTVPGSGKDYPVKPGTSLIIASMGINHKIENANSPVDMSKADFEWYDEHNMDTDVPEVPNMIKYYSYSNTIWIMHNRGHKGYLIFKSDVPMDQFIEKNTISTLNPSGSETFAIGVPNHLVIDAVESAAPNGPQIKSLPAGMDKGFTYCDGAGLGLCIKRKTARTDNGRLILQDTNNSTQDFEVNAVPSPLTK